MKAGALAGLVLALAPRALAATAEFPLWERHDTPAALTSADGYHYAEIHQDGEVERLYLDGRVLAQGPSATLCYNRCPLALSADGRVVAHALRVKNERRADYSPAVNGKPFGGGFAEIAGVQVSPNAGNTACIVRRGDLDGGRGGWSVLSAAGLGPAFEEIVEPAAVGEDGVLYLADREGTRRLYRDLEGADGRGLERVLATPSLRRIATLRAEGALKVVELNGRPLGRWAQIRDAGFDRQGRLIFGARTAPSSPGFDAVVVDGAAMPASRPLHPAGSPSGHVYWLEEEDGEMTVRRNGQRLGAWPLVAVEGWISFSPLGGRWAALTAAGRTANLVVDGKLVAERLPEPLGPTRVVFDSENELHYLGSRSTAGKAILVCVSLGDAPVATGACAGRGERLAPRAAAKP